MNFKQSLNKVKAFAFDVDGVLSSACVPLAENGDPIRMINTKDGYAIHHASRLDYPIAIITGGKSINVRYRFEALGCTDVYIGASNKIIQFNEFLKNHNLKAEDVMYMGDDIPDYEVMKLCGVATCPADAVPEIKEVSDYISDRIGGQGCVRDVIEQVLKAQGKWMHNTNAYTW